MVQDRVHESPAIAGVVRGSRPGVDHHPGGLVHHREIVVLVHDIQRNLLRHGAQRLRLRFARHLDLFFATQPQRGLGRTAVHQHVPLLQQQLDARAADRLKLLHQELVQPLPGRFQRHHPRMQCRKILRTLGCCVGFRHLLPLYRVSTRTRRWRSPAEPQRPAPEALCRSEFPDERAAYESQEKGG